MRKRDLAYWATWAGVLWLAAANNPEVLPELAFWTVSAMNYVGQWVVDTLNFGAWFAPAWFAWLAAPFATAWASMYLNKKVMDKIWVDNKIARTLWYAGSAVAWFSAGSVAQAYILWGTAVVGLYKGAKYLWKNWSKIMGESTQNS